jgi:thiamine-phosphate pyrophosphorylase
MVSEWRKKRQALFAAVDLYPVISSSLCEGRDPLEILRFLQMTPLKIVQMREKNGSKRERLYLAEKFRDEIPSQERLLIIDDDVDVALLSGADGVHLGNDDLPLASVRKLAPDLLIGKSCHNLREALMAQDEGADYINIGPIFETNTKVGQMPVGLNLIGEIKGRVNIPITVMGGITKSNLPTVLAAGATKVAMIKGLLCGDILKNVAECLEIFHSR